MKLCKSAKQDIIRLVKTLARSGMKIQEASKDIAKGVIMFPKTKTSYMKANTQKDEETCIYAKENTLGRLEHSHALRAWGRHPKHSGNYTCAPRAWARLPEHSENGHGCLSCALSMGKSSQNCFLLLFSGKARFLIPNSGENSPYKYHSSHL
jgi:hypothetical protein